MYMQEFPVIMMGNETKTQGCKVQVQCQSCESESGTLQQEVQAPLTQPKITTHFLQGRGWFQQQLLHLLQGQAFRMLLVPDDRATELVQRRNRLLDAPVITLS
jgi:hypothetical protein